MSIEQNNILDGFSGITPEGLRVLQEHFVDLQSMEHVRHGGQGVVFRAIERNTGRTVAVKLLLNGPLATPQQRLRFEREVELIGRLRHPNIVSLYGSGEVQGRLYFTMEFVDGQTIDDYALLNDLTAHDIVRLMIKVCRAINYSHQNGIIHRDLTPNNIFVDADGEPRIFDFGLAKDMRAERTSLTEHVVGTLPFMSPEQVGGLDGLVDTRTDVYSLGLILYHLLTEGFPYPIGGSFDQIRGHLIATEPIPLRKAAGGARSDRMRGADQLTRDLEAIIETALAKQKQDRYQSALALAEDLERYLAGEAVEARAKNKYYRIRKLIQRNWMAFSIAASFGLIILVSITAITSAWMRAATERDRANLGRAAAFDMFRTVIRDVERHVSRLPGGSDVTDSIIEGLEQQLPSLAQLGDDRAIVEFQAITLQRRGDLAEALGQRDQAGKCYRALFDLVNASSPDAVGDASRLKAYGRNAPYNADPRRAFEQAIDLGRRLLQDRPQDNEIALEAVALELRYADYLIQRQLLRDAMEHVRRTDTFYPPDAESAGSVEWLLTRANQCSLIGNIQQQLNEPDAALESLRNAERLARLALQKAPANTNAHFEIVRSSVRLGRCLRQHGRRIESEQFFNEAVNQIEFLAEMDPAQAGWDHFRATIYVELACAVASDTDSSADGLMEDYVHALTDLAERAELHRPEEPATRWLRTWTDELTGRWYLKRKMYAAAAGYFAETVRSREELFESDRDNLQLKTELAANYYLLGFALSKSNAVAAGLDGYRRNVEYTCEVAQQTDSAAESWLAYAEARGNLAVCLLRDDDSSGELEAENLCHEVAAELDRMESQGRLAGWSDRFQGLRKLTSVTFRKIQRRRLAAGQ